MLHINWLILTLYVLLLSATTSAADIPEIYLPNRISGQNVLVLYKSNDILSQRTARYYAQQRQIPLSQVVSINISGNPSQISRQEFMSIYQQITPKLTANIKVILLTWNAPYRVECMSITSAFAFGFDNRYCSHRTAAMKGCHTTSNSPYFNASSTILWQEKSNFRLSMMLSGQNFDDVKKLIDRGLAADNTRPSATAYLVKTHDGSRSTRWPIFKNFAALWGQRDNIDVRYIDDSQNRDSTHVQNKQNIMFYHTGLKHVPAIRTNTYLAGAIADHLTSGAGVGISETGQMKAFRWLEAGATASYGTVIEPCNYTTKFPNPQILIPSYADGDTLIEAYWKSVQQPGEGLFIGEPLARPWSKTTAVFEGKILVITSYELDPAQSYLIEAENAVTSQWTATDLKLRWYGTKAVIRIPQPIAQRYRITEKN